jgi:Ni,Fe-hydrogenase maturation factor
MIAMKLLDEQPPELVVLGVQPLSTEWSAELTAPVRDALPGLMDAVIAQLNIWNTQATPYERSASTGFAEAAL